MIGGAGKGSRTMTLRGIGDAKHWRDRAEARMGPAPPSNPPAQN